MDRDRLGVRDYYDEFGAAEWDRLTKDVAGRVSYDLHRRLLERFIKPGMRVLEIGAGPGRFTIPLAGLGAHITVTDFSPVQLDLNEQTLRDTPAESAVVTREVLDICDTARYPDDMFDAVVAVGGPLSYAFEADRMAVEGLLRITRAGGPVIVSVMSTLGTWRAFLPGVLAVAEEIGEDANDRVVRFGDLRAAGTAHQCQMYRSDQLTTLVERSGGEVVAMSASNFASLGHDDALADIEADPVRWQHFLDNEAFACSQPGAWDGGTHILAAFTHRARN